MNQPGTHSLSARGRIAGLVLGSLLALSAVTAAAQNDCDKPQAPLVPVDGATASAVQMQQAQQTLRGYMANGEAYQACLKGSNLAARRLEELHDELLNDMERLAALYNREVRRYRRRSDVARSEVSAIGPAPVAMQDGKNL